MLGGLGFLLIGWTGLLVPSLIRSVEGAFGQTDAGIGLFYFVDAVAYVSGSLVGGFLTERLGRRAVLSSAAALVGVGLVAMGSVPSWVLFLLAALPLGLGSGAIDGGVNGLYLDLYPTSRGQALNRVHLFFSLGALTSPLIVGPARRCRGALAGGDPRHHARGVPVGGPAGRDGTALRPAPRVGGGFAGIDRVRPAADPAGGRHRLLRGLGAGRVELARALPRRGPLSTATAALSLFWAGNLLGRLVSARFADRFDHLRLAIASSLVAASTIVLALVAPSLELAIALFALVGFASGPIYPLIMAIGGDRFPDRSAAVSGFLAGTAVIGSIVYPPVMGFMSVTIGLSVAMLGSAVLGYVSAAALVLSGRTADGPPPPG